METIKNRGISYCLISNGKKKDKLLMAVRAIHNTMRESDSLYDITIAGIVDAINGVNCIDATYEAENGYISRMRNMAAKESKYSTLVFLDDDILLNGDFYDTLKSYSKCKPWDILGVKLLLPDGGRCWDRATINPHTMIGYDDEPSSLLYQTGGFMVIRKCIWLNHQWADHLKFYEGEDVEYSKRLQNNGYTIAFDKENTAWHYDEGYQQVNMACLRKKDFGIVSECLHTENFKQLLNEVADV
jgi:hypothetical protein